MKIPLLMTLAWLAGLLYFMPVPAQAGQFGREAIALLSATPTPPMNNALATGPAEHRAATVAPQNAQVVVGVDPAAVQSPTDHCPNALDNGGFEVDQAWSVNDSASVFYDDRFAYSGNRSLSMNTFNGRTAELWQRFTIPATTSELTLDFEALISNGAVDQNVYVSLYDYDFTNRLQFYSLFFDCECDWTHFALPLDVTLLAGRTVNFVVEVYADGAVDAVNFDDVALGICQSGPTATPLPQPILVAPQGAINTDTPSFSWQPLPNAVYYKLWVNEYGNPNTPGKIHRDYTPAEANCATGNLCTVSPGVPFSADGKWWISAFFAGGAILSESATGAFTLNVNATATPTVTPTPTQPVAPPTPTATNTATPPPAGVGDAYEADDDCTAAKTLTTDGIPQARTFHAQNDVDWVKFPVIANTAYVIEGDVPGDAPTDLLLSLYARCNSGATTTQNYDFSPDVRLTFTATQSADYYLKLNNNPASRFGADVRYQLAVRPLTGTPTTGALIIVAGRNQEGDFLQTQIHNITNRAYRLWRNQGFPADRIRYLATDLNLDPDKDGKPDVNGLPDNANLRQAITEWAAGTVSRGQALTLYLMDHGAYDKLYLDEPRRERLTPQDLDQWLTALETAVPGVRVNVIIEACNAGSFIDPTKSISKPGRVIITSAGAYELAWATNTGALFSDALLDGLALGKTLLGAFHEAQANTQRSPSVQTPWLDDDGDTIPNDGDDGALAAQLSFRLPGAFDRTTNLWQPYVVQADVRNSAGAAATTRREIWAEVLDDGKVESVWAVIYPPSYQPPVNGEELVAGPPPITLQARGNHEYAGLYGAFDEAGRYRIVIYAQDDDGLHSPAKTIVFNNGSRLFLPLAQR
ncbi:MAG: hypothetical protein DYG89_26390 [Caldilinea sp. CFX5]|nr:hypothetical protein [Caldilinea sp. CFX5]